MSSEEVERFNRETAAEQAARQDAIARLHRHLHPKDAGASLKARPKFDPKQPLSPFARRLLKVSNALISC